jgi:hypothetical protein
VCRFAIPDLHQCCYNIGRARGGGFSVLELEAELRQVVFGSIPWKIKVGLKSYYVAAAANIRFMCFVA